MTKDANDNWVKINWGDGTSYNYCNTYHIGWELQPYTNKQFLKDLTREEKQPRLIRFLNVFLYGAMIIVDWLEKKLKRDKT